MYFNVIQNKMKQTDKKNQHHLSQNVLINQEEKALP